MNRPTSYSVGEVFDYHGVAYQAGAYTDTFAIATRVGAARDRHCEVVDPADVIKVNRC